MTLKLKHSCKILGGVVKLTIVQYVDPRVRVYTTMHFYKNAQSIKILENWHFDKHRELDIDAPITDEMYFKYIGNCIAVWMFQADDTSDWQGL